MKIKLLSALLIAAVLLIPRLAGAADEPTAPAKELKELITKVQAKLKAGKPSEAGLADELKEFDALLAKHKDEKTDDVAQILMMKAQLYSQVLDNEEKGNALEAQLLKDFPDSKAAARLKKQAEAKRIQRSLAEGTKFPAFDEKDLLDKPFNLAAYKGKVVLVDFWATWCGPCVAELPNVLAAYEKHHAAGFEIVGISLDSDKAKLETFIETKKMPWQQFFDGKGWGNKLAGQYGVNSIPATYLLDGEGKIIAKNLRGEALEEAVAKALAKK
jgi:thiol-disulfide isomerase/thioredoxin